jgi:phospholipid/cholesterol/gamma-HCH transport system substrate-binding protein
MTNRQLRWGLGVFVVTTLVLLAALILIFGSLPSLFKRTNSYTVTFPDAPGLKPGSPVRRSGVRIGEVADMRIDDLDGRVYVRIEVDRTYTVRHSERPTLVVSLFGNDASIDFIPLDVPKGQEDREPYPPGSEIAGYNPVSVGTLVARVSEVVPTTQEALNDIRKTLKSFEEMKPLVRSTLEEYRDVARRVNADFPDLAKSLRSTSDDMGATAREYRRLGENLNVLLQTNKEKIVTSIDNLNVTLERVSGLLNESNVKNVTAIIKNVRDASDHAPEIAKNVDELIKESQKTLQRLQQTLSKADAAMADIQKTTQALGDRAPNIAKNLDESLDKLNRTMTDVRELMNVLGQSDGTLNRILKDPSLYNNLDQTTCALTKLMPRLDRILKDMETFADKLARHPELIGIRGAVPGGGSDGLKEPQKFGTPPH